MRSSLLAESGVVGDISPPVAVDPEKVGEEGEIRSPATLIGTCSEWRNGGFAADRVSSGKGQKGDNADENSPE